MLAHRYRLRKPFSPAIRPAKDGDPEAVEEPVFARRPDGTTFQVGVETIEYWTYDRGSRKLPARLTVRKGVATKIELGRQ